MSRLVQALERVNTSALSCEEKWAVKRMLAENPNYGEIILLEPEATVLGLLQFLVGNITM